MSVGTRRIALRLTIAAGDEGAPLQEVGRADTSIDIPLIAKTSGAQISITVDTDHFADTVQAIANAASMVVDARYGTTGAFNEPTSITDPLPECTDHHPTQHRDAKPPWCKACGLTADGHVPRAHWEIDADGNWTSPRDAEPAPVPDAVGHIGDGTRCSHSQQG